MTTDLVSTMAEMRAAAEKALTDSHHECRAATCAQRRAEAANVLAVLDSHDRLEAALRESQEENERLSKQLAERRDEKQYPKRYLILGEKDAHFYWADTSAAPDRTGGWRAALTPQEEKP